MTNIDEMFEIVSRFFPENTPLVQMFTSAKLNSVHAFCALFNLKYGIRADLEQQIKSECAIETIPEMEQAIIECCNDALQELRDEAQQFIRVKLGPDASFEVTDIKIVDEGVECDYALIPQIDDTSPKANQEAIEEFDFLLDDTDVNEESNQEASEEFDFLFDDTEVNEESNCGKRKRDSDDTTSSKRCS